MKKNQKSRRPRIPHVRWLFALGIPEGDIAKLVGKTEAAVKKQIRELGGVEAFPDRPKTETELYVRTFRRYTELKLQSSCREKGLRDLLAEWLECTDEQVFMFFRGMYVSVKALLCNYSMSSNGAFGYADLLTECYDAEMKSVSVIDTIQATVEIKKMLTPNRRGVFANDVWLVYLEHMLSEPSAPVENKDTPLGCFAIWFCLQLKTQLKQQVTPLTCSIIDCCLARLGKKLEKILRMKFGIGCEPVAVSEIASRLKLENDKVDTLIKEAAHRLKRQKEFQCLLLTQAEMQEAYLTSLYAKLPIKH